VSEQVRNCGVMPELLPGRNAKAMNLLSLDPMIMRWSILLIALQRSNHGYIPGSGRPSVCNNRSSEK
jgi:hypothetical protein